MNKWIKIVIGILIVWLLLSTTVFDSWMSGNWSVHPWLLYIFIGLALVLLMVSVALYVLVKKWYAFERGELKPKEADPRNAWQKFAGLHSLSAEKDMMLSHEYDGITELDNPTPPWFMYLFYGTIIFAVIYVFNYTVFNTGKLQLDEYSAQMAKAKVEASEREKRVGESLNESSVTQLNDAAALDAGKAAFTKMCATCHGAEAEGKAGPNLTDEYWLHGGAIGEVFHTVKEGILEKGMPSWKKQLSPEQMQQVASYILSLQGTHPANAKEPQGEKVK